MGHSRHRQQLLVDKLQRIDALLELDVLIGELGLIFGLTELLLDHLLGALRKRREASATRRSKTQDRVSTLIMVQNGGRGGGCEIGERGFEERGSAHLKFLPNACTRSMMA